MPRFKLTVAYDGTGLIGWQRQASGVSVQGLLESACAELDGQDVAVAGAGRTDSGVHAIGQVAGVTISRAIDARGVMAALNSSLPPAVRVLAAAEAAADFHPRFHARAKTYRYRIWNSEVRDPFERLYSWHLAAPCLDVELMNRAATLLEGRHDFAALQASGSDVRTTERTVFRSSVTNDQALISYEITGDGFLRHMVRNIVGTLVEIGRGKRSVDWLREVLASRDRGAAGPTAPAEGLFLVSVEYD